MHGIGRSGIEEHNSGVVEHLNNTSAENIRFGMSVEIIRARIVDFERLRIRTRTELDRCIQRTIGRAQIAAHVQGRDILLAGHSVEAAGIGLGGQFRGQCHCRLCIEI